MPVRVAIAEDDHAMQAVYRQFFPDWELTIVSNGLQALYQVGRQRPHLTILDIYMPTVDGIEAVQGLCPKCKSPYWNKARREHAEPHP